MHWLAQRKAINTFELLWCFWECRSRTAGGGSGVEPTKWRDGDDGWTPQTEENLQPDSAGAHEAQQAVWTRV